MSQNDSLTLKIFFKHNDGSTKVKKYVVDKDVPTITNFDFFRGTLLIAVPQMADFNFKITWKDAEGDDIAVESNEDLRLAFSEMAGPLKTFSVAILDSSPARAHGVLAYCNGCGKILTGYRYKCLQCEDYDLCNDCEHDGRHSIHLMLRLPTRELYVKYGRKIIVQVNKVMETT